MMIDGEKRAMQTRKNRYKSGKKEKQICAGVY